jgi:hypothetical protein
VVKGSAKFKEDLANADRELAALEGVIRVMRRKAEQSARPVRSQGAAVETEKGVSSVGEDRAEAGRLRVAWRKWLSTWGMLEERLRGRRRR